MCPPSHILRTKATLKDQIGEIPSIEFENCIRKEEEEEDFSRLIRMQHHQQTLKELKEVLRCVEVNQHEFVETIDVCYDHD